MAFACNIDTRGRWVRLVWGLLLLALGAALASYWARPTGSATAWTVTVLALLGGLFGIFQAMQGWCVMRAMGFKTPV